METIASLIDLVLTNISKPEVFAQVSREVQNLCEGFPLYAELRE
jgi:glycine/serine hydroxymethyltransferase